MSTTLVTPPSPEDIDSGVSPSEALERQADAILADAAQGGRGASRPVGSVRQALREDATLGRDWIEARVGRAKQAVRDEPVKSAVYAAVAGVVLGLLLNR